MEIITKAQENEFETFVLNHPNGSFMQSMKWPKVKNNWLHEAVVSRDNTGNIVGAMLVLIRKMPLGKSLLYSPRGPVCDLADYEVIKDLLEGVKAVAKKHKAYMFKTDPYVLADNKEFINKMREMGFSFTQDMSDSDTWQTRNNYMLNIEGKTLEELSANFHHKWRYNIKLAQRKGVECKVYDKTHIDEFYELMKVTGERDGFAVRPKEYFVRMLESLGTDHCRMFLCHKDGTILSGAITTQFSGKTCYVYGASSNEGRNLMPNHLMQWEMITWAVENNNRWYDFQGIPYYQDEENPASGIYKFKKGFNGEIVEFAGEFDYIFDSFHKKLIDLAEKTVKKLRAKK